LPDPYEGTIFTLKITDGHKNMTVLRGLTIMARYTESIPEKYRGPWCDEENARSTSNAPFTHSEADEHLEILRRQWARFLMDGDLKRAHKLWGKWQGYSGQDPWEEPGWRLFWERQRGGEKLWEDFNALDSEDKIVLRCFISYWGDA
jgi:hypothetical protein